MTNYVCYNHGFDKDVLAPLPYLDVEFTKDQSKMMNPTVRDLHTGAILSQFFGDKAKTKIARRRIDFMTGNINSYARILNGPSQLASIKTYNDLASSMTEYNNEVNKQKEAIKAQRKEADAEKLLRKADKSAAEIAKWSELLVGMEDDMAKGADFILGLSNPRLCEFGKY